MPYKMEAFTLSRNCLKQGKVTHLMKIIPPKQNIKFLEEYDEVLGGGFVGVIGMKLADKRCAQARLPSMFEGVCSRTGILTMGAQHLS